MEDVEFVVTELLEFEYWDILLIIAFLEVSDNQASDARAQQNNLSNASTSLNA